LVVYQGKLKSLVVRARPIGLTIEMEMDTPPEVSPHPETSTERTSDDK
jgi:hypothetical protein